MTTFNFKLFDNVVLSGINYLDYPDYSDAFIESADYDGKEMTDKQLDDLNEDYELVHELVWDNLH